MTRARKDHQEKTMSQQRPTIALPDVARCPIGHSLLRRCGSLLWTSTLNIAWPSRELNTPTHLLGRESDLFILAERSNTLVLAKNDLHAKPNFGRIWPYHFIESVDAVSRQIYLGGQLATAQTIKTQRRTVTVLVPVERVTASSHIYKNRRKLLRSYIPISSRRFLLRDRSLSSKCRFFSFQNRSERSINKADGNKPQFLKKLTPVSCKWHS
ncbi:hypothetical protein POHY109586_11145 [Polaromonas hydrogenivorans]